MYFYSNELTPERTQENKNKSITISLLVWALKVN